MKNLTYHAGKLEIIGRVKSSPNGNPRYLIMIDGFRCYTKPDSMHGYVVSNYKSKVVHATIGTYYGRPTLNTLIGD